ncbi:hypothetical protein [Myxococcus xanthus]|uniref:hypothetical protein n=1 Tax=Myxococcus xanthus TaxID=34 RepID=UPI003451E1E5
MNNSPALVNMIAGPVTLVPAGTAPEPHRYACLQEGAVRLLNSNLDVIAAYDTDATLLLAARGLERLVLSDGKNLLIVGDHAVVVPDLVCDAAACVEELIIATAPGDSSHRILLIDPASGKILDDVQVAAEDATAFITRHPSSPTLLVELPMGQSGSSTYKIELAGGSLRVEEILAGQDPVIAGFNPSGTKLLVTPYPDDPEVARVFAWPSLEETGRLTADELDAENGIGLPGCWVDEESIALYAVEDSLILTDQDLGSPVRADFPIDLRESGDIESLKSLEPGRIAVGVWEPEGRSMLVLEG